jgi:RNA polymerase sigma factor (sigma-70 family)
LEVPRNHECSPFNKWANTVFQLPTLKAHEERILFEKWKKGDLGARDTLVTSNLYRIFSVIHRYNITYPRLEDVAAEGVLGLFDALDHYRLDKGAGFGFYSEYWIRWRLTKAISHDLGRGRSTSYYTKYARELREARKGLMNGTTTYEQLSKKLHLSEERLWQLCEGYDGSLLIGDETFAASTPTPEDVVIEEDRLEKALQHLTGKERTVVKKRLEGFTLDELGAIYGVTRERVRQIESRARPDKCYGKLKHLRKCRRKK